MDLLQTIAAHTRTIRRIICKQNIKENINKLLII